MALQDHTSTAAVPAPERASARLRGIVSGQLAGVSAQLLAALPAIIIPIFLARTVGLAAVAEFAVLMGAASIGYTGLLFGLRHRLVIDRLETFGLRSYAVLRAVALALLAVGLIAFGRLVDADPALVIAILLMRMGDVVLDLLLALDQVRREGTDRLSGYLAGASVKALTAVLFCAASLIIAGLPMLVAFSAAMVVYFGFMVVFIWRRHGDVAAQDTKPLALASLFTSAVPFMAAAFVCAVLTALPRLVLAGRPDAVAAGAEGAALSLATLGGMAFYAVWLQWAPKLTLSTLTPRNVLRYSIENLGLAVLGAVGAGLLGAFILEWIYDVPRAEYGRLVTLTLVWAVAMFGAMNFANLFKPSRLPWLESGCYILAVAAGLAWIWVAQGRSGTTPAAWTVLVATTAALIVGAGLGAAALRITKSKT